MDNNINETYRLNINTKKKEGNVINYGELKLYEKVFIKDYNDDNMATRKNIEFIKDDGYGVSIINKSKNQLVFLVTTSKKKLDDLINVVKKKDSKAFITIKETRNIINGYM